MHEVMWGMQAEKDASGSISISAGDTVRWVFEGRHSVESGTPSRPDGLFSSGRPGARSTYDFRFTKPGVYPYFCRSHSGMVVSRVTVLGPEGELYTWGYGANGRLGHGDSEDLMLPKRVEALRGEKINAAFAGFDVSAAVSMSGQGFRG